MAIDWDEPVSDEMREHSMVGVRVLTLILGLMLLGFGVALLVKQSPHLADALWGGALFTLMGIGCVVLAWFLPSAVARTEEERQRAERTGRRFGAIAKGGELFFLTLALLGLVMPESLGLFWTSHRPWVLIVVIFTSIDLLVWLKRRMRARSASAEAA